MNRTIPFLSILAVCLPGSAQTPSLWTPVDNQSGKEIEFLDSDATVSVGNLYLAPAPDGEAAPTSFRGLKALRRRGDKFLLPEGRSWLYFDTTGGGFAMNFKAGDTTEFNVKFAKMGTVVKKPYVSALGSMSDRKWSINSEGFLNASGPAWLTFR